MIDKESQDCVSHKGQLISKANCQALNSSKIQMNEFFFTNMRRVFVRFFEEIEDSKKAFRNYLTFKSLNNFEIWHWWFSVQFSGGPPVQIV